MKIVEKINVDAFFFFIFYLNELRYEDTFHSGDSNHQEVKVLVDHDDKLDCNHHEFLRTKCISNKSMERQEEKQGKTT